MKRILPKLAKLTLLTIAGVGIFTHVAHAQVVEIAKFFGMGALDWFDTMLSYLVNALLAVAAWFIGISGTMLNISINLTLHIRDFVNATPAVYQVWQTIRDISGMFIIFFLLYAAIKMILGQDAKFGDLIKNIVIAGVLINFSFFFTGLAIDASNVVSLALYHAITPGKPTTEQVLSDGSSFSQISTQIFADGGLSNVFMQSLHINNLYDSKNMSSQGGGAILSQPLKIIMIGATGIIIMVTASLSFAAASLAFIVRLVILLLLLAFSPIWFAAHMIPNLDEYAKKWSGQFVAMLTFMPVYLLLMYAALSILNNSKIFNSGATTALFTGNLGTTGDFTPINFIMIAVNAAIVIIMLNIPLIAAISMGGSATEWLKKKKIGAGDIWKSVGSQVGSRTIGRAAYHLNESDGMRNLASKSPLLGGLVSDRLAKVSSAGFGVKKGGYEDRLKAKKKQQEDMHKRLGTVDRANYPDGTEGDAAFKHDKEAATEYQKTYRDNLAWKNGTLAFMLDNRGNRQSQIKLNKDAANEAKKEAKKKAEVEVRKAQKVLNDLINQREPEEPEDPMDKELADLAEKVQQSAHVNEARKTLGLESLTESAEQRVKEIGEIKGVQKQQREEREEERKDIIKLQQEVVDRLKETIQAGEEVEKAEKDSKLDKDIKDLTDTVKRNAEKSDSGGGGGDKPKA